MRAYYVYIMASRSRVLYTGVTNDLTRRVHEHKFSLIPGFTSMYRVTRLVHFEEFTDVRDAIAREKQIKGWVRARKIRLIEEHNPAWEDRAAPHGSPIFFVAQSDPRRVILSERATRASEGPACGSCYRVFPISTTKESI
jgi:putative endonuclease